MLLLLLLAPENAPNAGLELPKASEDDELLLAEAKGFDFNPPKAPKPEEAVVLEVLDVLEVPKPADPKALLLAC